MNVIVSSKAEKELNAWASQWVAQLAGAAGFVEPDDLRERAALMVTIDPPDPRDFPDRTAGVATMHAVSSERLYSATPDKYFRPASIVACRSVVMDSKLSVETALVRMGYPPILVALLLHVWPREGKWVPRRAPGYDVDNPVRSFRPLAVHEQMAGRLASSYLDRSFDGMYRTLIREFSKEIR